ncbi:DUF4954 family protein [candidate division KSB1 bacterium]|nr:DUF4954 family protein [candidate division KSB1 bacterium]
MIKNNNTAEDWNQILVAGRFETDLVQSCEFGGIVRINELNPGYIKYNGLRLRHGLFHSTIISSDIGSNVAIRNVHLLSRYSIGDRCLLFNVQQMLTTDNAKFGIGIIAKGETEAERIWVEICNENGGRRILTFPEITATDAFIWAKFRDDARLMEALKSLVDRTAEVYHGRYGIVGKKSVIANCRAITNTAIGDSAIITGANRLENLTVLSSASEPTHIIDGGELVHGIIGFGNRISYGNKAIQFATGRNCRLNHGARLFNCYMGANSTISCCEVLSNLIFPFHEQHHNNSFLIACTLKGQSNIAAGATIGSNHNSRAAEGEIIAGRGFWPGLCASLKHNCKFASFTLIAKGHYAYEMNIMLPFSLISLVPGTDQIQIIPAYWFLYNMYALARNAWKFGERDRRVIKNQHIEVDYLAPDTVEEMLAALDMLALAAGKSAANTLNKHLESDAEFMQFGKALLDNQDPVLKKLTITLPDQVNRCDALVLKAQQAFIAYKNYILFYCLRTLIDSMHEQNKSPEMLIAEIGANADRKWWNIGGQLMEDRDLKDLLNDIKTGSLSSWDDIHQAYDQKWAAYPTRKLAHALQTLEIYLGVSLHTLTRTRWTELFHRAVQLQHEIAQQIRGSRAKDFSSAFRKMIYDSEEEMTAVLSSIDDIEFVRETDQKAAAFEKKVNRILRAIS